MRESDIEAALVARVKALGGECRKVKWIGRNGAPDQLVVIPALVGSITIWVELKSPGEKPRPLQVREHQRMEALGQTVLVIDSIELIDKHFPLN